MTALRTFGAMLSQNQSSYLNIKIEQYPILAVISIKKFLMRDYTGIFLKPSHLNSVLLTEVKIGNQNQNLKRDNLGNFGNSMQILLTG